MGKRTTATAGAIAAAIGASAWAGFGTAPESKWPTVAPLTRTYHFSDAQRAAVPGLIIRSRAGKPLYRLSCYSSASAPATAGTDYSGAFQCRLAPLYGNPRVDLFSPARSPVGNTALPSRFTAPQLAAPCPPGSRYGRYRDFFLRNVKLTLAISDIAFLPGQAHDMLKSFAFSVNVAPAPAGTRGLVAAAPPSVTSCPPNSPPSPAPGTGTSP